MTEETQEKSDALQALRIWANTIETEQRYESQVVRWMRELADAAAVYDAARSGEPEQGHVCTEACVGLMDFPHEEKEQNNG